MNFEVSEGENADYTDCTDLFWDSREYLDYRDA